MEHLALIFWVIIIILSIISSIAKKKTPVKKEGEDEEEEENHLVQRKALEQLLGVFSDEEQPQPVTLTTQAKAIPEALPQPPPAPQPSLQERPQHRPVIAPKDITVKKQQKRLLEMDPDLVRQGIILSEILGPPRAENPF